MITESSRTIAFCPGVEPEDATARYWLSQATLRLRREILWMWAVGDRIAGAHPGARTDDLDLQRFSADRANFDAADATNLTADINQPEPARSSEPRGSFGWIASTLELSRAECFVLGLSLLTVIDHAAESVIARCTGRDGSPTMSLAQRLWDDPLEVVGVLDPRSPLRSGGVIRLGESSTPWTAPISVSARAASILLGRDDRTEPWIEPRLDDEPSDQERRLAERLALAAPAARILPIRCAVGDSPKRVAARLARHAGAKLVDSAILGVEESLTSAWLSANWAYIEGRLDERSALPACTICVDADRLGDAAPPGAEVLPTLRVAPLTYQQRIRAWRREMGDEADEPSMARCAHRYRIGPDAIRRAAEMARTSSARALSDRLETACRAVVGVDLGDLAEPIEPGAGPDDLVLAPPQRRLMSELVEAVEALPRAHASMGSHAALGISAALCGPSGTGKSLGVRVLAARVGLPLYRVDLSQVVNKFVGETPKRLKALFDATEICDLILWFDEADSFFGRRVAASNAQDRWACMEVNYLLQRMDGARAVTVLTTNRKDELDQAFLRRLQFVIDFALPDERERIEIWERAVAPSLRGPNLELHSLGKRFRLTGAQIGAAAKLAGLQAARRDDPRITMEHALSAVWRELEKENRPFNPSHFGRYAALIERIRGGEEA